MLKFSRTLEVIVPKHRNHGQALTPIEQARIQTKIDALTRTMGGVTWYDTCGRWFDGQGDVYDDSHRTYQWFIEGTQDMDTRNTILSEFDALMRTIFKESGQKSITLKLNNNAYIVDRVSMTLLVELDTFIRKEVA